MIQLGNFSCQVEECAADVSYPASGLAMWRDRPICETCFDHIDQCVDEDEGEIEIKWVDLPSFVPWYDVEITRLKAEIEQCHAKSTCCCGDDIKTHGIDSGHAPVSMYDHTVHEIEKRVEAAEEEVREYDQLLELHRKREQPWIAAWQAATGKDGTLPDYGDMLAWIAGRAEAAEKVAELCDIAASGSFTAWPEAMEDQMRGGTPLGWRVNRIGEIIRAARSNTFNGRETLADPGYYWKDH